jgi:hypothetical protein
MNGRKLIGKRQMKSLNRIISATYISQHRGILIPSLDWKERLLAIITEYVCAKRVDFKNKLNELLLSKVVKNWKGKCWCSVSQNIKVRMDSIHWQK